MRKPNSAPRSGNGGVPQRPQRPQTPAESGVGPAQPKPAKIRSIPKLGAAKKQQAKATFGTPKPKQQPKQAAPVRPISASRMAHRNPQGRAQANPTSRVPGLRQEQSRLKKLAKQDRTAQKAFAKEQLQQIKKFTRATRTRRIVTFTTLGSVLALVGLVLATMFTPLMAIKEIQVSGTHRLKSATIKNAVSTLIGTPLTLVSEDDLQKRLASFSLIQSFTTLSLPPHTLQINIVERQPIGIVQTTAGGYLYDPAGVLIGPTKATWKYPTVVVAGDPRHSANYRAAIDVLLALPVELYPRVQRIQATSKDDVRLLLRGAANQQILWGDSSKSVMKSKVLAALMANTKKSATVTYDVSSPSAPTVRYGNF